MGFTFAAKHFFGAAGFLDADAFMPALGPLCAEKDPSAAFCGFC
jgi:hypothetical protein